jgi:hypothetical protein
MLAGLANASADACDNIERAIQATCRVYVETGKSGKRIYGSGIATCEFFENGKEVAEMTGDVIERIYRGYADVAVIKLTVDEFIPPTVKILVFPDPAENFPAGTPVVTVGAARGAQPTLLPGQVVSYESGGKTMLFNPSPANGRSGSALFTADCSAVVGLLHSRRKGNMGVAMSSLGLYLALEGGDREGEASPGDRGSDCPDGSCPNAGGRRRRSWTPCYASEVSGRNFNMIGRQIVDTPPAGGVPAYPLAPGVDHQANARIAVLEAEVARLAAIAQKAEDAGLLAGDAKEAADEALEAVEEIEEEVEDGSLLEHLKERLGSVAVSSVLTKIGIPATGVFGLVIFLVYTLIKNDIKDLRQNGDPLFISKIAERTRNEVDDKIAARLTKATESDLAMRILDRVGSRVAGGSNDELLGKITGLKEQFRSLTDLFGKDDSEK